MKRIVEIEDVRAVQRRINELRQTLTKLTAAEAAETETLRAAKRVEDKVALVRFGSGLPPQQRPQAGAELAALQAEIDLHKCWAAGQDVRLSEHVAAIAGAVRELWNALGHVAHQHLEPQIFSPKPDWWPISPSAKEARLSAENILGVAAQVLAWTYPDLSADYNGRRLVPREYEHFREKAMPTPAHILEDKTPVAA